MSILTDVEKKGIVNFLLLVSGIYLCIGAALTSGAIGVICGAAAGVVLALYTVRTSVGEQP